jgi:cytochrome P450
MLLDARDEAGQPPSDVELRDEIITLLIGGDENTALGLAWTLYFLARHPELQAEVHRELDALGARHPEAADLSRLPLLRACLDESLRLRPPVWAYGRSAKEPDVIGGVAIPAGASVTISPWALHRHPEFFTDPEEFRPARFLDDSTDRRAAYMPFGAGERVCVGRQLAVVESVLVLAVFLQRFALEADPEHEPELVAGVSLAPRDGIRVVVRERRRSPSTTSRGA